LAFDKPNATIIKSHLIVASAANIPNVAYDNSYEEHAFVKIRGWLAKNKRLDKKHGVAACGFT
jgi:hypothetical protein